MSIKTATIKIDNFVTPTLNFWHLHVVPLVGLYAPSSYSYIIQVLKIVVGVCTLCMEEVLKSYSCEASRQPDSRR